MKVKFREWDEVVVVRYSALCHFVVLNVEISELIITLFDFIYIFKIFVVLVSDIPCILFSTLLLIIRSFS